MKKMFLPHKHNRGKSNEVLDAALMVVLERGPVSFPEILDEVSKLRSQSMTEETFRLRVYERIMGRVEAGTLKRARREDGTPEYSLAKTPDGQNTP